MRVSLDSAWSSNGLYYQVVNLYVTNLKSTAVPVPWQLAATNSAYTSLNQVRNPVSYATWLRVCWTSAVASAAYIRLSCLGV